MSTLPNYSQYISNLSAMASQITTSSNNGSILSNTTTGTMNSVWTPKQQSLFNKEPTFEMVFYPADNGGYVMELKTGYDANTYVPKSKIFIIKEVESMGADIQNILFKEILKG